MLPIKSSPRISQSWGSFKEDCASKKEYAALPEAKARIVLGSIPGSPYLMILERGIPKEANRKLEIAKGMSGLIRTKNTSPAGWSIRFSISSFKLGWRAYRIVLKSAWSHFPKE